MRLYRKRFFSHRYFLNHSCHHPKTDKNPVFTHLNRTGLPPKVPKVVYIDSRQINAWYVKRRFYKTQLFITMLSIGIMKTLRASNIYTSLTMNLCDSISVSQLLLSRVKLILTPGWICSSSTSTPSRLKKWIARNNYIEIYNLSWNIHNRKILSIQ